MGDGFAAISRLKSHGQFAWPWHKKISCPVLIAKGMAANDNGFFPAGNQAGNIVADDGLAKDRAANNIADGAVWRLPHFF